MRIVAIADMHYETETRDRAQAVARAVCDSGARVLVIAGDCAADGWQRLDEVLALFGDFEGHRLMVPGNHDLWQNERPFGTRRVYDETIPRIAEAQGFHCLDTGPKTIDGTAFVGSMGWYDYGMRQTEPPVDDMTVTPIQIGRGENGRVSFSAVPGVEEKGWEALEPEDYAANGLIWQTDGSPRIAVWNDALHLSWERSAPEMAEQFARRLREQVAAVADDSERVVGVTHFVPFAELADHASERPAEAFVRAYLGSALLGEALMEAPNLELVIYGHRHEQQVREVQGIVTADADVSAGDGPLLLTLPD